MAEARVPNPLVEQFRKGAIPADLRLLAAQGALPLLPADLIELLHLLTRDREPKIRETAVATLRGIPPAEMLPIAKDRLTTVAVLDWILVQRDERELREVALQNTSTSDDAIESLAGILPPELAELVVINQVRLLRRTSLLEVLEGNQNLNNDQKRRLRELRETFRIGVVAPPAEPPPPPPVEEPVVEAAPEPEPPPPATEAEALERYLDEDERGDAERVSVVQRVFRANTAEKVILALKGGRAERAILIRDANRIVASAVLGSPRLTDPEIEAFAGMKNLSDEILRQIGHNREWTKKYGVLSNLVKNPRTPLAISLNMVSRLNPRDIRNLSVDRNVSEVVRKQAQKFVKGPKG